MRNWVCLVIPLAPLVRCSESPAFELPRMLRVPNDIVPRQSKASAQLSALRKTTAGLGKRPPSPALRYSRIGSYRKIGFVSSFLFSRLGPTQNGSSDLLVSFYPPGPNLPSIGGPKSLQVLEVSPVTLRSVWGSRARSEWHSFRLDRSSEAEAKKGRGSQKRDPIVEADQDLLRSRGKSSSALWKCGKLGAR